MYGPTEYTTYATAALTTAGAGRDPPIGRPISNTQVYVLDRRQQMLPIGVVGELYIAGVGLACGYLGQSELSAQRFVDNPFGPPGSRMYRTGDLVRWTSAGELEFIGRADHQVKLRGFRVELGEIEARLRLHSAVRDAVVLVHHDRPDNASLLAYIVPNGEAPFASCATSTPDGLATRLHGPLGFRHACCFSADTLRKNQSKCAPTTALGSAHAGSKARLDTAA